MSDDFRWMKKYERLIGKLMFEMFIYPGLDRYCSSGIPFGHADICRHFDIEIYNFLKKIDKIYRSKKLCQTRLKMVNKLRNKIDNLIK